MSSVEIPTGSAFTPSFKGKRSDTHRMVQTRVLLFLGYHAFANQPTACIGDINPGYSAPFTLWKKKKYTPCYCCPNNITHIKFIVVILGDYFWRVVGFHRISDESCTGRQRAARRPRPLISGARGLLCLNKRY